MQRTRLVSVLCGVLLNMVAHASEGPNLISNPSLETGSSLPDGWTKASWGTNNAAFTYPASPAASGARAARVDIASYSSGDAKWFFTDVAVTAGASYHFVDAYSASVTSTVTARFRLSDGTYSYQTLAKPPASSSWSSVDVAFSAPSNAQSLTVFHLLNSVGSLSVDGYELHQILAAPTSGNLVLNPSLETSNPNGSAYGWLKGYWGTHNALFTYPVAGLVGQRAARIDITSYTSGDAKWYFTEVPVTPGTAYTFTNSYAANVDTHLVAQFRLTDGSIYFTGSTLVAPSGSAQSMTFIAPPNASTATVFHLLNSVGSLTIDNYSFTAQPAGYAQFPRALVSIDFDDGYADTLATVMPILDAAGFKTTQYIISGSLGGTNYVTAADVLNMQQNGHEIGAHTRTHPDLTTLNASQLASEISGSRQDLIALGVRNVNAFAYPYGAFNSQVVQAVKDAGFSSASNSQPTSNLTTDDHFMLRRDGITSFDQAKAAIDDAIASKSYVKLLFHHVDYSGGAYAVTPEVFQQIISYLQTTGVSVVTTSTALGMMQP